MKPLSDWICLSLLPGLGVAGLWRLVNHFGNPAEVLSRSRDSLARVPGIRGAQLAGLGQIEEMRDAARYQIEAIRERGGTILCWDDSFYPDLLRQLPDPPPVLYTEGDLSLLESLAVAIVGSRSATSYGLRVAHAFGKDLSMNNITVISGLALGIDSEGHRGALDGTGSTIGVLGCGLDVVYPRQNKELYNQLRNKGLLITEYPLGTRPEGFRFPARNRIIAGLSHGILVVEAAMKSGSLITAQMGVDFGREVFAVPGQIDSFKSEGAHHLIRQGAHLVSNIKDILDSLRFDQSTENKRADHQTDKPTGLNPALSQFLDHIEPYPQTMDEVIEKAQLTVAKASELFLMLELEGCIEMLPGDMVRKIG